jgi:hypothetical protein
MCWSGYALDDRGGYDDNHHASYEYYINLISERLTCLARGKDDVWDFPLSLEQLSDAYSNLPWIKNSDTPVHG